ncbi:hypothetical protein [Marisediminicola sp. LYQ134]|uniref:hypothetical protein n=1 Tax=Marisediminicola sp. LYQ134 TaxID=3391061 RepID=UPI003983291F
MTTIVTILSAVGAVAFPVLSLYSWRHSDGRAENFGVLLRVHPSFWPPALMLLGVALLMNFLGEIGFFDLGTLIPAFVAVLLFGVVTVCSIGMLHGVGAGVLYPAIPFLVPPRAREKARRERAARRRRRSARRGRPPRG